MYKLSITFILIVLSAQISAQEKILLTSTLNIAAQEYTYSWGADTSATALQIVQKANTLYLLANIAQFEPGNGIPIEGEIILGSGLAMFDLNAQTFGNHYTLNTLFPTAIPTATIRGYIPTQSFGIRNDEIFMPSSSYRGWLPIDDSNENLLAKTFGKQIACYDNDFNLVIRNINEQDLFARKDDIKNTFIFDDRVMVLSEDQMNQTSHIAVFDTELNLVFEKALPTGQKFHDWKILDNTFIYTLTDDRIYVFDQNINEIKNFPYAFDEDIYGITNIEVNQDHIVITKSGSDEHFNPASVLQVLVRDSGVRQSICNRSDLRIVATELFNDKIMITYDTRLPNNLPKTYATPIGFEVLDLNLDLVHYEEMGEKFTAPTDILMLEDGQIAVLGFVNNNWEFEDTRAENKLYLWIGDVGVVSNQHIGSAEHLEAALYPNPVRDWINISFNAPHQGIHKTSFIEIYSMSGKLILRNSLGVLNDLQQNIRLDFSSVPAGTYKAFVQQDDIRYSLGTISKQ